MAFSELEKVRILRRLNWPPTTIDSTSLDYSKIVSDRLTNASTIVQSEVRIYLDRLEKMDEKLDKAICRAGVKSIDDIELRDNEIDIIRRERNKVIKEMAVLLNIRPLGLSPMGNVCA